MLKGGSREAWKILKMFSRLRVRDGEGAGLVSYVGWILIEQEPVRRGEAVRDERADRRLWGSWTSPISGLLLPLGLWQGTMPLAMPARNFN